MAGQSGERGGVGWVQEAVPLETGGELCLWCRMEEPCRRCGVRAGPHAPAVRRVGAALAAAPQQGGGGAPARSGWLAVGAGSLGAPGVSERRYECRIWAVGGQYMLCECSDSPTFRRCPACFTGMQTGEAAAGSTVHSRTAAGVLPWRLRMPSRSREWPMTAIPTLFGGGDLARHTASPQIARNITMPAFMSFRDVNRLKSRYRTSFMNPTQAATRHLTLQSGAALPACRAASLSSRLRTAGSCCRSLPL